MVSDDHPQFDSIRQTNMYGIDYWSARSLMPLLGYGKNWYNFQKVIQKAKIACEEIGQIVRDHFHDVVKMVEVGSGAQRKTNDYLLSKRACYLIAMNSDPHKHEVAAAQNYFAVSTEELEMHQLRRQQQERLAIRLQVADENTKLFEAAQNAGVLSANFGLFNDAGYIGLYKLTAARIAERKGIPEEGEILDFMGSQELAANLFRITQTEGKLVREQIMGEDQAIETHHDVGREVRKAIEAIHAPMPEDLPRAASIRAMVEAERRKGRKRLTKPSLDDNQESLF